MASSVAFDKRMKTDIFGLQNGGDRINVNYGTPEEVEDKYLRLQEEHLLLKKHAVNQEDKLKKLTTKLTRLLNEKKKWARQFGDSGNTKDVESEELVQDLKAKIYELEKLNLQLKEKLLVTRQQVFSSLKKRGPYQHVPPKVDTGQPRINQPPKVLQNGRITNGKGLDGLLLSPGQNIGLPPYAVTLLEDAQNEIRSLEEQVSSQRAQLEVYEQEVESLNEQLKVKESEYEEELTTLRSKLTQGKKQHVQENLDLIKLNREVKQKSSKLSTLEAQYTELEEKTASLRFAHDQLVKSLEEQQGQLEEERQRARELQSEVNTSAAARAQIQELQMLVDDLSKENMILKTSNDQLIQSALDPERDLHIQSREESLKKQIFQLETVLKGDLAEKSKLVDQLKTEKERRTQLEEELKVLQNSDEQKKSQINELEKRMKFFTQESEVDFGELEEALALVQQRKRTNQNELGFLLKVDEGQEQIKQQLKYAQAEKAETVSELEQMRNMLLLQYKVSREAQDELERLRNTSDDLRKEFQLKMEENSNLLDLRETRIQKLERQLRDIASGTKQSWEMLQVNQNVGELSQNLSTSKSSHNILEIRMHKVLLSAEGVASFGNRLPSLFITWVFFRYDLQSSSIIRSNKLDFNCSAQYEVELDANFLHYLSQESVKIELHLSQGTTTSTIARTYLPLREIFDNPNGDHHKITHLTGCRDGVKNLNYGTLHCNIVVPDHLEEAVILFKERLKAAGYLECNQRLTAQALEALDRPKRDQALQGVNELHVKVVRCRDLQARRKGYQPSPFCRYRFFQLTPQETLVIPASSNPEFNDHRTFSVSMDEQLDTYLRTQKLQIFVFDEAELNKKDYIGKVSVSLRKLLRNELLKGSYSLQTIDGAPNGFVDMIIYWQFPYTFVSSQSSSPQTQTLQHVEDTGSKCLLPNPFGSEGTAGSSGTLQRKVTKQILRPSSLEEEDEGSDNDTVTSVSALNPEDEIGSSILDEDSDLLSTSSEEDDRPPVEVVVVPSPSRKLPSPTKDERVIISVNSLHLLKGAAILDDPSINLLYVEYRFLDCSAEELETPFALPKPHPPKQILFNFRKVFIVNPKTKSSKRKLLLDMMNPAKPKSGRLTFTIVSEPPAEETSGECEDVGYAFVDFKKIFDTEQDILDEDIEVYDITDRKTILGYLNVRVEVIAVLKSLSKGKAF